MHNKLRTIDIKELLMSEVIQTEALANLLAGKALLVILMESVWSQHLLQRAFM
jgi:hypothetical protein